MQNRVPQIDWLRCVFIVLMVMFHLVYLGGKYPFLKQVVYTFHMPAFLLISGYLANMDKSIRAIGRQVWWLFVPYAVMEAGYVVMASVLPIREHIDGLTPGVFADKLLLHPLGPYWYLHTMMVCYVVYYAVSRLCGRMATVSFVCVLGLCMYAVAALSGLVSMDNAMYFMAGVLVRRSGAGFTSVFRPSWAAVVPLVLLCVVSPGGMHRFTLQGVVMTYLSMSLALAACGSLPRGGRASRAVLFVGANTLPILLFSPLFTIVAKSFVPLFAFDPTAVLFTVVSVTFVIAGSLGVARLADVLHVSRLFCGRERMLTGY